MSKWLARARSENLYRSAVPKLPKSPKFEAAGHFGDFGTNGTALLYKEDGAAPELAQPEIPAPLEPTSPSIPTAYRVVRQPVRLVPGRRSV